MTERSDADILTSRDRLEGTATIGNDEIDVVTTAPTIGELQDLDDQIGENPGEEAELILATIDDHLIKPDVEAEDIPLNNVMALWVDLQQIWAQNDRIEEAMQELDTGNRSRTSRR